MTARQSGTPEEYAQEPEAEHEPEDQAAPVADASPDKAPLTMRQVRRPLVLSVAGLVLVLLAGLVGWTLGKPSYPNDSSADAGFARDMQVHHAQAVEMSLTIRNGTSSKDVAMLAYDIITTQENQRGEMAGWLQTWGLPLAASRPPMEWMKNTGHSHPGTVGDTMLMPDGRMPGMATQAQLRQLRTMKGKPAEVFFLQLMIIHHRSGVKMAQACIDVCRDGDVVTLATKTVNGQQNEIKVMSDMLSRRGAKPLPDPAR